LEFFDDNAEINPAELYLKLNKNSPSPFSAFYKLNDKFIISASPERYLQRKENRLISQPIKGTIKRGKTEEEDKKLINQLKNDEKELSENKMIVDLVRNDLSRTALKSSVKVVELCEIYTFNQLHQMISTIESKLSSDTNFSEIIKNSFPMGSMTGAPKVRAMQLIEEYEKTKRGAYSGSVGYIDKNGDFDFNVVIRSILYNQSNKYLSYITGSAITRLSIAESEYKECKLKAKALFEILGR
jgi:para-aminobenzoate synthetase component 1